MRRTYTLAGVLLAVALVVSACAPATPSGPVEAPSPETVVVTATPGPAEPVTIRFATLSGPEFTEGYGPIVDRWNAEHPEIQVEYETYPWGDYWVKIPAMTAAGNPPDVLWTGMGEMDATWVARGIFAPLDSYVDGPNGLDHSDWDPRIWDFGVFNDQVYVINTIANIPALAYNKDLFDEAGVAYPDDTWTWDDVLAAAKLVTTDSSGLHPDDAGFDANDVAVWGIQTRFWPINWFPVLWSFGGRVYNEEMTQVMYTDPADVEALAWWGDLVQVHHVAPPYEFFGDAGWDTAFGNGLVAMHLLDSNQVATLGAQFPDLNYGTTVMPSREPGGDRYVFVFGRPFGISNLSQHKDEAWEFLRYLCLPEAQAEYAQGGRGLPASQAALDAFLAELDPETQALYAPYVASLPYIYSDYAAPDFWTVVAMPLMEAIQGATTIVPGTTPDYENLMTVAADKANNILGSPVR
jgi:multiple sugar transport system substrate-binding protein